MSERSSLLASIADTIKDYRAGELVQPTPDHVDRWIRQFDESVQVPMLREIDHVFKKTYVTKTNVIRFFENLINYKILTGDEPCDFWKAANIFDIQQDGHSQTEIRKLFGKALKEQCDLEIEACGSASGAFIYFDDFLFSGSRIGTDLSAWIENEAPAKSTVHIMVIATYRLGEWQCKSQIKEDAATAGKELELHCWASTRFENRLTYRNTSDVLWPTEVPEDATLQAYIAEEDRFPFKPRQPVRKVKNAIFSSEEGRQLLERELLLAGMRIRSFSQNPSPALRPLGFSRFGLGFGSMIVMFRNCPNNSPLAFWWGDPDAAPGHPLRNWYPLLPRKTYAPEVDSDDFGFLFEQ